MQKKSLKEKKNDGMGEKGAQYQTKMMLLSSQLKSFT